MIVACRARPGSRGHPLGNRSSRASFMTLWTASLALDHPNLNEFLMYASQHAGMTRLTGARHRSSSSWRDADDLHPHRYRACALQGRGAGCGKLRALGVSAARRLDALGAVPTLAEAGLPGLDLQTWTGMLIPARRPRRSRAQQAGRTPGAATGRSLPRFEPTTKLF
jgi:hypothetical protein